MFAGKIYCPVPSGPHSSLLKTAALYKLFCAARVFRRKFAFMRVRLRSARCARPLYDEPAGPSWAGRRSKKNWLMTAPGDSEGSPGRLFLQCGSLLLALVGRTDGGRGGSYRRVSRRTAQEDRCYAESKPTVERPQASRMMATSEK